MHNVKQVAFKSWHDKLGQRIVNNDNEKGENLVNYYVARRPYFGGSFQQYWLVSDEQMKYYKY